MEQQTKYYKQQKNRKEEERFDKMEKQKLLQLVKKLNYENKRLKNRLAGHQPFKQKNLRNASQQKIQKLFQKYQTRKYALKICYIGFNYDGMACQSFNDNTVEEYLFRVMHIQSIIDKPLPFDDYTRAGRTDKGVSAMGNVVSLPLRTSIQIGSQGQNTLDYCQMMNAVLPEDIRVLAALEVASDFNARYNCTGRSYKYFFAKNNLNMELMNQRIKDFLGKHNFLNFCKMNVSNCVKFQRTIKKAEIIKVDRKQIIEQQDPRGQIFYFHFVGDSFLWHQIRYMSSILFMIGQGKQSPNIILDLLDFQKFPRKPNYAMAPQYPLILEDCQYDDLKFTLNQQTVLNFYNTFNQMVLKTCVEKVLIINCMMMARKQLVLSHNITQQLFVQKTIEKNLSKMGGARSMKMHKSSGRGLEEAIQSLKGRKLELYEKKAKKHALYEERVRKEKKEKQNDDDDCEQ